MHFKHIKLFLFLCIASKACLGQNINLNQGETTTNNYYVEIPFEFVNSKIIVPVNIGGKTYRFLFDTGAPTIISEELFKTLETTFLNTISVSDANQNKDVLKVVSVPKLIFGTIKFQNIPVLVHAINSSEVFSCFKIDGFIGSNMLRNTIVQIDLNNKIIKLTDNKKRLNLNKKKSEKLKLLGVQSSPYIWIRFNEKVKEQVLIDTGMSGFYDISHKNFNILQKENLFKVINTSHGAKSFGLFGGAEKKEQKRLLVPNLLFSNSNFTNLVTTTTNDTNSRIGAKLLNHGIITIDFKNKRFYFNAPKKVNLKKELHGFDPMIIDNKLVVGFVWNEELKKKINFGDQILKINDIDFTDFNICSFITQKSLFKSAKKLELLIKKTNGDEILIKTEKKIPTYN